MSHKYESQSHKLRRMKKRTEKKKKASWDKSWMLKYKKILFVYEILAVDVVDDQQKATNFHFSSRATSTTQQQLRVAAVVG